MTPPQPPQSAPPTARDQQSALFANLVLQQTNMALMFMGQVPHPESGQPIKDLEGATMFIDTLEMLAERTRGNLSPEEDHLLRQSLTSVRMAFVEATREGAREGAPAAPASAPDPGATAPASAASPDPGGAPAHEAEEARKKFVKKY